MGGLGDRLRHLLVRLVLIALGLRLAAWLIQPALPWLLVLGGLVAIPTLVFHRR